MFAALIMLGGIAGFALGRISNSNALNADSNSFYLNLQWEDDVLTAKGGGVGITRLDDNLRYTNWQQEQALAHTGSANRRLCYRPTGQPHANIRHCPQRGTCPMFILAYQDGRLSLMRNPSGSCEVEVSEIGLSE